MEEEEEGVGMDVSEVVIIAAGMHAFELESDFVSHSFALRSRCLSHHMSPSPLYFPVF